MSARVLRVGVIVAAVAALTVAVGLVARSALSTPTSAQSATQPAPSPLDEPAEDTGGDEAAGGDAIAEPAPGVPFETFDGQPASIDDWQGQPVVLNFWASWCPPCVAEMRDALEPLHQEFGDQVTFLGVNLQDEKGLAQDVVDQTGVTYELAADPDGALFTAFGGFGMPTTVFLDASGNVVETHTGSLTESQLDTLIRELLET